MRPLGAVFGRRLVSAAALAGLAGAGVVLAGQAAQAAPSFVSTGSLVTGRADAVAVALYNGEVLVAGGTIASGAPTASAEVYQPATGQWSSAGSMPVAVTHASATLLSNGEVLVAGGLTGAPGSLTPTADAELYNPSSGTWSATGPLSVPTSDASIGLLKSGQAIYAGGMTGSGATAATTNAVEFYNPVSGGWSATGYLPVAVADAQMAVLPGGDVLLAGGETKTSGAAAGVTSESERYEAPSNSWVSVGALPLAVRDAQAVTLSNGDVLVAGGAIDAAGTPTSASELFDASSNTWSSTGFLPFASAAATMTALGSSEVLYAGGMTAASANPTNAAALFDVATNQWSLTNSLLTARAEADAVVLRDGDVLVTGGRGGAGVLAASELYPASAAPAITSSSSVSARVNSPLTFTVTTSGTPAPALSESGNLPAGISFHDNGNGTATISGTPSSRDGGTYRFTITAANSVSSASQSFDIVFTASPAITSAASAMVTPGQAFSFTVTTSGTPPPSLQESGSLPPGLIFKDNGNGTATISGTARGSDSGVYTVTVSASNAVGSGATQSLNLLIAKSARFISGARLRVTDARAVRFAVRTTGDPIPTISVSGPLPRGLVFSAAQNGTATISGTPAAGQRGVYRLLLTASNGVGAPAHQRLVIVVLNPAPPTSPRGVGYWYVTSAAQLLFKGAAHPIATHSPQRPANIAAMAVTPDHQGYYLVSAAGGVFSYGTAKWYGSAASLHLRTTVVAFAVTPDGGGYYEVTRAGNVLTYGDAHFLGSTAGRGLPPIGAFGLMPGGGGYYLVTIHGNIYTYGTASFLGSPARDRIPAVTGFGVTPDGRGYWVSTTKGDVLSYGDARFYGSLSGRSPAPVVAFAPTADGRGYWVVTSAGNVFGFGDARWYGSSAGVQLGAPVTAFAALF